MVKPQLLEEKPIMLSMLKEKLAEIKEREKELNFRSNKTDEYLSTLNILPAKKAKELAKKLADAEIPRLKEEYISKIVDLLPNTVNDVKLLFQVSILTLSADNIKKIVELVNEYAKQ